MAPTSAPGAKAKLAAAAATATQAFLPVLGDRRTLDALTTLACEGRRGQFFAGELFDAMRIVASGDIALDRMEGSWAGAMGQPQFMPSTFQRHAVDADGDGRRDIWSSLPDIFGSAGNFLNAAGWRAGEEWGQEVVLPPGFDYTLADLSVKRAVADWQALGVRSADGRPLANGGTAAALLLPAGWRGPAFITYPNFGVILNWNRSFNYALAVGLLADRIAGRGPLIVQPAIAWVLMVPVLKVDPEQAKYAVVLAGMPAGINVYVFATYYNRAVNVATNTILISTVLSVFTVAGWLYVMGL